MSDVTAWLIERGGLCLGFREYRFAWVTFTDEDALRFSRERDAYSFRECIKWEMKRQWLDDTKITEHVWCESAPTWKCKAQRTADPPQDCDWPTCGCDPYADKVIETLQEAGKLGLPEKLAELIGNVLTRWEQLPNDVSGELDALNAAMKRLWTWMEAVQPMSNSRGGGSR